jgi:iron(III) transport system substrate-binding protein
MAGRRGRPRAFPCVVALLALVLALPALCGGCRPSGPSVTVYTSVDDVFARPILEAFERESGIRVDAVFDVEATKTTGLYHRLLAERERPRADVFWNSEVARTVALERKGLLAPLEVARAEEIPARYRSGGELSDPGTAERALWAGFGLRARVIVYNTDRVAPQDAPRSIRDLADERFRGKAAIADPLFGTTATHVGALRVRLGPEGLERFLRALLRNEVRVVAGNSTVRDRVASGELLVGLTDTDDANVALQKGEPLGVVFPDQEQAWPGLEGPLGAFVIPNTVARIRGAPHPQGGKALVDFLLRASTEAALARGESAQIPVRAGIPPPERTRPPDGFHTMDVPYGEVADGIESALPLLLELFVR